MAKVDIRLSEGFRVDISARNHGWLADEPAKVGGTDQGPTPYEHLLGALGACTVLTIKLYATHKKLDLKYIEVEYEYSKEHAEDCRECESEEKGLLDIVRSQITIHGDFDDAQKERLTQIVSRCPVHKTLEKGIKMFDKVEFG